MPISTATGLDVGWSICRIGSERSESRGVLGRVDGGESVNTVRREVKVGTVRQGCMETGIRVSRYIRGREVSAVQLERRLRR